jgi:outer membrane protein assembly factor BamB
MARNIALALMMTASLAMSAAADDPTSTTTSSDAPAVETTGSVIDLEAQGASVVRLPGQVETHLADPTAAIASPQEYGEIAPIPAADLDSDQDWNNFGGNAQRNGRTGVLGPKAATLLWSNTDDYSIISWHPVTLGDRVFAIRESGFPQSGGSAGDKIVAYDLDTGEELWSDVVPYGGDPEEEWIAYIGGANDGKVYCARGGSGRTTPIYAYDAATGDILWASVHETIGGPQDGFVFAANGDLLVADFDNIARINAVDGSTIWVVERSCPVSGSCGCVANEDAAYIVEAAPGGNVITHVSLVSGELLYSSPLMDGFTAQNGAFLSPDGNTVYFARSQNNPSVDYLYAFFDNGTEFNQLWRRAVRWTTVHEHGVGLDGSIYTFLPGDEFVRLNPINGNITGSAGVLSPVGTSLSPRTAIGADGTVYISNGFASSPPTNGRVWAFTPDLFGNVFTLPLNRQNSGGPSLGKKGTLVVADRAGVYAYRTPCGSGDLDCDGDVDLADHTLFTECLAGPNVLIPPPGCAPAVFEDADLTGDDDVDITDWNEFELLFTGS